MSFQYCKKYGFTPTKIEERLRLLEFDDNAARYGDFLQRKIITPNAHAIVDQFYDEYLLQHDVFRKIIGTAPRAEKLKHTQRDYLLTLGVELNTPAYFEVRLRVGAAHARIALPITLYECAYWKLRQILTSYIPAGLDENGITREHLCDFVSRVTALDMSLATECYHQVEVSGLQRSVAQLMDEEMNLRKQVATDELTGLANRGHVISYLERAIHDAAKNNTELSVIMADLDHFKQINDTHGHLIGDRVLQDTATRIFAALRHFDIVGRYGGEEFVIVLINTGKEVAYDIAERIRIRVGSTPMKYDTTKIHMTISQGVAQARRDDTVETLIARADEALYRAKDGGRNLVTVAD